MAVAAYVRVSTQGQKLSGQKAAITRWLNNHKLSDDVTWFEDHETGANLDRPGFQDLQSAIFDGEVDTVVIWKLDRLSRSLIDGITILADWADRGVRVVAVTQQIDMSGALGRMVAAVMLSLAEIEREYIRERQAAGIAVAKAEGRYTGRKPGSTKAKPKEARRLRKRGLTVPQISQALGVSPRTVARYFQPG